LAFWMLSRYMLIKDYWFGGQTPFPILQKNRLEGLIEDAL